MTVDKFNRHIIHHKIKQYAQNLPSPSECVLYIRGKEKGSQKFQEPFYTFILENNSVEYVVPIKEGVIENVVYYPNRIQYHYNGSGQTSIKKLLGRKIVKGDKLVFTSIPNFTEDCLFIELLVKFL